jgi:hypothetical protein
MRTVRHRELDSWGQLVRQLVDGSGRHAAHDGRRRSHGDRQQIGICRRRGINLAEDTARQLDQQTAVPPGVQIPRVNPQGQRGLGGEGRREEIHLQILHG